jgi:serine/threonine protein kinase
VNNPLFHITPEPFEEELCLGACLGQGGMSQVWAATRSTGTPIAVKASNPDVMNRVATRELILREYRFLNDFSHRNIVSVLGLIEMGGEIGLVMEYVGGGDLVSLAGGKPRQWVPVAAQLASALGYMHALGILHRDIKVRNVLLRPGDEPCLIDFSLAVSVGTRAHQGGGTADYQSANQRQGGPATVGDDVYSFAALIYELWTGTLPFGRNPSLEMLEKFCRPLKILESGGIEGLKSLAELVFKVLSPATKGPYEDISPFADALELASIELSMMQRP